MTAVTVLENPGVNCLSSEDLDTLRAVCHCRLDRGIAGHLAQQLSDKGDSYAAILNEPEGEVVFKLYRFGGIYSLSYCSPLYGQHTIAEGPDLPEVLEALPEWPPAQG